MWQPSLVLGRPARALTGPYSLQRLYTGPGTPSLLRHIIQAHSLEVSKRKVTSVSDIPPLKLPSCGRYTNVQKTSSASSP